MPINDPPTFKRSFTSTEQPPIKQWTVGAPEQQVAQINPSNPPWQERPLTQQHPQSSFDVSEHDLRAAQQAYAQRQGHGTSELSEFERSVKEARHEKATGTTRISQPGKQRLEILAGIGRLTKDVTVGGITFSLRTLKSKETREVALSAFSANIKTDLEASYEMRRQQLARAVCRIDGHPVEYVIGDDSFAARLNWIDNDMEESVVSKLFAEMQVLNDEAKKQFEIKTEEQAKEVAEDLKK